MPDLVDPKPPDLPAAVGLEFRVVVGGRIREPPTRAPIPLR